MAEQCGNCGVELFTGQRFCRACGASTDELGQEQAPTRRMPPQPDEWSAPGRPNTAPGISTDTSPVYAPTGYQPSVPPMPPYQAIPPYAPPRTRSRLGWVLAFIGMGLFALIVFGVMMMARFGKRMVNQPGGQMTASARAGEAPFVEGNADKVERLGTETTLTRSFTLSDEPKITIKNTSGSISISVWDKPQAEVRVTRRGSDGDRNFARVLLSNEGGNLSIRTDDRRGGADVRYELKLPRKVAGLELTSVTGAIKLSDIEGEILVQNVSGQTDLTNIVGLRKAGSVSGNINIVLKEWQDERVDLNAVSGNISLQIKSNVDADLEATAATGTISLDDSFGITVENQMVGQRARGKIGDGGETIKATTVSGNIKIGK